MQAAQVNTRACCHMLKLLLSSELQLNFLKSWILIFKTTAIENDMLRVKNPLQSTGQTMKNQETWENLIHTRPVD